MSDSEISWKLVDWMPSFEQIKLYSYSVSWSHSRGKEVYLYRKSILFIKCFRWKFSQKSDLFYYLSKDLKSSQIETKIQSMDSNSLNPWFCRRARWSWSNCSSSHHALAIQYYLQRYKESVGDDKKFRRWSFWICKILWIENSWYCCWSSKDIVNLCPFKTNDYRWWESYMWFSEYKLKIDERLSGFLALHIDLGRTYQKDYVW